MLPLGTDAYSAGSLHAAAHTTPHPTTDLVLLSGSLLHLDLCINVLLCLPPVSRSLPFLLSPGSGGHRMLMRKHAVTTLGALVLLRVVTAVLRLLATWTQHHSIISQAVSLHSCPPSHRLKKVLELNTFRLWLKHLAAFRGKHQVLSLCSYFF